MNEQQYQAMLSHHGLSDDDAVASELARLNRLVDYRNDIIAEMITALETDVKPNRALIHPHHALIERSRAALKPWNLIK